MLIIGGSASLGARALPGERLLGKYMSKGDLSLPPAVLGGRSWAEAVFHVLAHVVGAAPSSLWDPRYVRRSAQALGPPEERPLAEDARLLAQLLADHAAAARAQLLAWLFVDAKQARALALIDLTELDAEDVDAPEVLPALRAAGEVVEILRCAAALEAPLLARLPPLEPDWAQLAEELERTRRAAPLLSRFRLRLLPPLMLRGRVRGTEIWVGVPTPEGPSAAHVAWQAAHEATVAELSRPSLATERDVEHAALVVMAQRARRAGLEQAHATWLSHFAVLPSLEPASLSEAARALIVER